MIATKLFSKLVFYFLYLFSFFSVFLHLSEESTKFKGKLVALHFDIFSRFLFLMEYFILLFASLIHIFYSIKWIHKVTSEDIILNKNPGDLKNA